MIGLNYRGKLGQLGNQMFQYAALMGIADKLGTSFTIPNHNEVVEDGLGNKLRIELFDAFKINPPKLGLLRSEAVYQEKTFEFNPNVFDIQEKEFILFGFFQTEKYFSHIKDKVKKEFTFQDDIVEDCKEMVSMLDNPVALHIRRGDYIINNANHHNLSMEYYAEALKEFPDRQVIIFSDDPNWCHIQEIFEGDRFLVAEGNGPYHDLYLMTQCNDFIIANSTFSWWGAWLADKGTVIAPNKWFGPNNANKSTKDLYPEHWKVIPFS
jgi:hypothetical protein